MLLPALNQARDRAQAIKCTSNLKQQGTASSLYMGDYQGWLPGTSVNGVKGRPDGIEASPYVYTMIIYANLRYYWKNGKWESPAGNILQCPGNRLAGRETGGLRNLSSYACNTYTDWRKAGSDQYYNMGRPSGMKRAARWIYVIDFKTRMWGTINSGTYPLKINGNMADNIVDARHNNFANSLFMDLHVNALHFKYLCGTNLDYLQSSQP